jgi:hypothetical protein
MLYFLFRSIYVSQMKTLKPCTLAGFDSRIFCSGGGRDDRHATQPGRAQCVLQRNDDLNWPFTYMLLQTSNLSLNTYVELAEFSGVTILQSYLEFFLMRFILK